jgi:hypothetical protein
MESPTAVATNMKKGMATRISRKVSIAATQRRRTERLQIVVSAQVVALIDEFRFASRMPSRAAAVRELLRRGLAQAERAGDPTARK